MAPELANGNETALQSNDIPETADILADRFDADEIENPAQRCARCFEGPRHVEIEWRS